MIWAIVTLQKEGFHLWKDAPNEVSFLRNRHRHMFKITVQIEQRSNDRDIEYFILKHWLENNIPIIDGGCSCETIATAIKEKVEKHFMPEHRRVKVEVLEDGENGAIVE